MRFTALPTDTTRALQSGGADAYGQAPEKKKSDGEGNPCRHCLRNIPKDAEMLILAYRPFDGLHPYAETGPIFLCAEACVRGGGAELPPILRSAPDYLVKGYGTDDRIVYGTGAILRPGEMAEFAAQIFEDPKVAYLHVRSARNNCYQTRIDRG